MKHTRGEWKVRFMNAKSIDDGESDFFVEAPRLDAVNKPELGYNIEILGDDYGNHNGYSREQRLADATLIAAAPDLLDVCRSFCGFNYSNPKIMADWVLKLDNAIQKATNEPK